MGDFLNNLSRARTCRAFLAVFLSLFLTFSGEDRCGGDDRQGPGPRRPHLGRAPASPAEQPAHLGRLSGRHSLTPSSARQPGQGVAQLFAISEPKP